MKKIVIVLLILTFASISSAQGFKLGVAGNAVFPTGDWKEFTGSGWGVDAFGVFDLMLLTLTVRAGYLSFGENEQNILGETFKTSITAIPVMAGLRWNFGAPVGPSFYVGAEAGIHSFTTKIEAAGQTFPSESTTEFAFAPNVGVEIAGFDISGYYMIIKDANYFGVRLGYGFGI
jgi:opacity protein-like surface antigen